MTSELKVFPFEPIKTPDQKIPNPLTKIIAEDRVGGTRSDIYPTLLRKNCRDFVGVLVQWIRGEDKNAVLIKLATFWRTPSVEYCKSFWMGHTGHNLNSETVALSLASWTLKTVTHAKQTKLIQVHGWSVQKMFFMLFCDILHTSKTTIWTNNYLKYLIIGSSKWACKKSSLNDLDSSLHSFVHFNWGI